MSDEDRDDIRTTRGHCVVCDEYENQLGAAIEVANAAIADRARVRSAIEALIRQFDNDDGTDIGGALAFAAIRLQAALDGSDE